MPGYLSQPIHKRPYTSHEIVVPVDLAAVNSELDYVGLQHILEFTAGLEEHDGKPIIPLTAERLAASAFSDLIIPASYVYRNNLSQAKLHRAYRWYGLDIQTLPSEAYDLEKNEVHVGVGGLIAFVRQTFVQPEIIEQYPLHAFGLSGLINFTEFLAQQLSTDKTKNHSVHI